MATRLPSNRRMSHVLKSRKRLPSSANRANAKNQRMHDPQRCHAYHPLKARVYLSTLTVANGRCPLFITHHALRVCSNEMQGERL